MGICKGGKRVAESELQGKFDAQGAERRRHPRAARRIEVNLKENGLGQGIQGHTWNISPVGAYCLVKRPIPEMTQLMMVLDLPADKVVCQGTVVRQVSDPENPDYHQLAIFFHDISEGDQQKLSALVEN